MHLSAKIVLLSQATIKFFVIKISQH